MWLILLYGILTGFLFYGGLWITVRKAIVSHYAAWWFLASFFVRTALVLWIFYLVSGSEWKYWLVCLTGFLGARLVLTYLIGHYRNGKQLKIQSSELL